MNWLILLYFLELGFSPLYSSYNSLPVDSFGIENTNIFYVNLDVEVEIFDHLFIGGAVKTYTQNDDGVSLYPFEANYLFKAGLRFNNLELGFKHFCLHPVRPYEMYYEPQGSTNSAYEEFYIRITNR